MDIPVTTGDKVACSKTIGESDVYLFAGITGDLSPNHVDEAFMRTTPYGRRIAHGALIVGYMSRASTLLADAAAQRSHAVFPVSLGYDRIRFLAPVFIGDTLTVNYEVTEIDKARGRSLAKVEVFDQDGKCVAAAVHAMRWLERR
jgi:acyl dehydratase